MDKFNLAVGGRLRAARRQRGLSLGEVEASTSGEFKASVVGAYERGERAVSVLRFVRLADFYGVEPAFLLPATAQTPGVVIDLEALESAADGDLADRYLAAIRLLRRGVNPGEVREADRAVISSLLETAVQAVTAE